MQARNINVVVCGELLFLWKNIYLIVLRHNILSKDVATGAEILWHLMVDGKKNTQQYLQNILLKWDKHLIES